MAKDSGGLSELKQLVLASRPVRGRFSDGIRERLVAYAKRRSEQGASIKAVAEELGVNHCTLSYWRARLGLPTKARPATRKTTVLKRVKVIAERRPGFTLRGGCGTRVDDLTLGDLAELPRKLS
jgi:transposase-like protein